MGVAGGADGFAEFFGAVVFVEEVVGDFFEVGEVGVQEGGADGEEIAVARVVDFDGAPRVLAVLN